jgi:hypothetical protein
MKSPKPTQFEVRIYNTPTNVVHVSLSWRHRNKLLSGKISFEKMIEAKEVVLDDGKTYIVSFDSQRRERVRVSLFEDFRVEPCIVTLKEKESSVSL